MNDRQFSKYEKIGISFILLIILMPSIILNRIDPSGHKLIIADNTVKIKTEIFKVDDIENIELLEEVNIGSRIKGTGTLRYLRGSYKIGDENKVARVYVYKKSSPYIKIELKDRTIIYNDEDSNDTRKTYEALITNR